MVHDGGPPRRARVAVLAAMILLSCARSAGAYCRTTTCPLPPSFSPSEEMCAPTDFASYCAMLATPVTPLPLWWRNACVSYDLQQDVAAQFPTASALAAKCFAKWTTTTCGAAGKVSIDVSDLGPVACDEVHYNSARTGVRLTLDGYGGLTLAWVEGIEVNLLGLVAGLDLRHPGLKLPGVGRIGVPLPISSALAR